MKNILSYTPEELTALMAEIGEPKYRAGQIFSQLHKGIALSEMTNVGKKTREKLEAVVDCSFPTVRRKLVSAIDGTVKYLFELSDKNCIESVVMKYEHGYTICISSQVGCRMGCKFCASTLDGLERSLLPSEMLDQIYAISRYTGERVSNVVVMGSGEPMDNYDNLLKFIELLTDENGLNISQRNITVSTCGLVPKMRELADRQLQITLALSLHATTDEKRRKLMPIANKYGIGELMEACKYYFEKTGRRLTFEYSLVGGVNDADEDARELIDLVKPLNCHVNLIPVNPIKERDFVESNTARVQAFKNKLEKNKIQVTIRREMGRDIDGACGQLRRRHMNEAKEVRCD